MIFLFCALVAITDFEKSLMVKQAYISLVEEGKLTALSLCSYYPLKSSEKDSLAASALTLWAYEMRNGASPGEESVFVSAERFEIFWEIRNSTIFTPERAVWKIAINFSLFKDGDLAGLHESEKRGYFDVSSLKEGDLENSILDFNKRFTRYNIIEFAGVSILCAGIVFAFYYIR
ncbi:hypothetical protein JW890_02240 [candidate division WOR-3 bacterium]|nr:hypothetical protein [candidate division WOR-3 bacterium]